jgi:predicted enzyme related to lactoylglutathione lyase
MGSPVVHFEINGKRGKVLHDFYAALFDWKVTVEGDNPYGYGLVDTGADEGIGGGVGQTEGQNLVTVYVEVPDLEAALAKVERLGGKRVMPPMEMGPVTMARFADPDGNVIGLVKGG